MNKNNKSTHDPEGYEDNYDYDYDKLVNSGNHVGDVDGDVGDQNQNNELNNPEKKEEEEWQRQYDEHDEHLEKESAKLTQDEIEFLESFESEEPDELKTQESKYTKYPNFHEELTKHFILSGFSKGESAIASICILGAMSPDFKVDALTYRGDSKEFTNTEYMLNLYLFLYGEANSGKSTLLNKMLNIYESIIGPSTVVSAKSSSMGLFKQLDKNERFILLFGDDADWLLDPNLKDGTIVEALLQFYYSTKIPRLLQSHERTEERRSVINLWLGIHEFTEVLNKDQIYNGLMRRFLPIKFASNHNTKEFIAKSNHRQIYESLPNDLLNQFKNYVNYRIQPHKEKNRDEIQEKYMLHINNLEPTMNFMAKIKIRLDETIKKYPEYLAPVIQTYFEILQRASAIVSLWDGSMVYFLDDEDDPNSEWINMIVREDTLKAVDDMLWTSFEKYYTDLANTNFDGKKYIPATYEDQIEKVIDKAKMHGKTNGENFIASKSEITRNLRWDNETMEKVFEIGNRTERFKMQILVEPKTHRKHQYIISNTPNIASYLKSLGYTTPKKNESI